jgi:hypothetical protein
MYLTADINPDDEPPVSLQIAENMNALVLLKLIAQGEEDIGKGKVYSQQSVFNDMEIRLTEISG